MTYEVYMKDVKSVFWVFDILLLPAQLVLNVYACPLYSLRVAFTGCQAAKVQGTYVIADFLKLLFRHIR